MHRFGAILIRQLSVLCDDSMWANGGMHKRCYGTFLAKTHSPSGQEPDQIATCTCPCHETQRQAIAEGNKAAWEYWEVNRAPLNRSSDRWMNAK